jgi:hypothetical protein
MAFMLRVQPETAETGEPDPGNPGKSSRIPLPNYADKNSRLKYAQEWTKKYGPMMQGRGDTPLRINEIPNTANDRLTAKQASTNAAKKLGLDPALFYASSMEEGMSGIFKHEGSTERFNNTADENFPVNGFLSMGLDTFAGNYDNLAKKGYLPAGFDKKFHRTEMVNEKGDTTHSADFRSVEDALHAKAAMIRSSQDDVDAYAKKNNINLSPKAKEFFTLVSYNGGPGVAMSMIKDYNNNGHLKDDAFLKSRPTSGVGLKPASYSQPYDNVIRRLKMRDALRSEGYFDDEANTAGAATKPMLRVTK